MFTQNLRLSPFDQFVSLGLQSRLLNLFKAENFCFATYHPGRTPSLYFVADRRLQGGCPVGRLRTSHWQGALIQYSSTPSHYCFFSSKEEVLATFKDMIYGRPPPPKVMQIISSGSASIPCKDDYLFDFVIVEGKVRIIHFATGKVRLEPKPTTQQIKMIIDQIFESGCGIHIDYVTVEGWNFTGPRGSRRQPVYTAPSMDLAPYLASFSAQGNRTSR